MEKFEAETNEFDVEVAHIEASKLNHDMRLLIEKLTQEASVTHRVHGEKIEAAVREALKTLNETQKKVEEAQKRAHQSELDAVRSAHKSEVVVLHEEKELLQVRLQTEHDSFEERVQVAVEAALAKQRKEHANEMSKKEAGHTKEIAQLMRDKDVAQKVNDLKCAKLQAQIELLEAQVKDHEATLKVATTRAASAEKLKANDTCAAIRIDAENVRMRLEEEHQKIRLEDKKRIFELERKLREKDREHKAAFDSLEKEMQAAVSKLILTRGSGADNK